MGPVGPRKRIWLAVRASTLQTFVGPPEEIVVGNVLEPALQRVDGRRRIGARYVELRSEEVGLLIRRIPGRDDFRTSKVFSALLEHALNSTLHVDRCSV